MAQRAALPAISRLATGPVAPQFLGVPSGGELRNGGMPRVEGAVQVVQRRLQFGIVAPQDAEHRVVADPVHACFGVGLFVEVRREKTVALQPARGHDDGDVERRL